MSGVQYGLQHARTALFVVYFSFTRLGRTGSWALYRAAVGRHSTKVKWD